MKKHRNHPLARTTRIAMRQERVWLIGLPIAVAMVTAVLAPGYTSTYTTADKLELAVSSAQESTTTLFLYGRLAPDASIVQMAAWELGALTCLALAVIMTLRTATRSRGTEDLGSSETLRGAGVSPVTELLGTAAVLVLECVLLGAGAGVGLRRLGEASAGDAWAYGAAVCLTCGLISAITLTICQLLPDATAARSVGLTVCAALYAGHGAWASHGWGWAGAWSPLALRGHIDPGGGNHWVPAVVAATGIVSLLVVSSLAASRRDLGAALFPLPSWRRGRLRAYGPVSLTIRLCRLSLLTWAAGAALCGGVLTSMGGNTVSLAEHGALDAGGTLGTVLGGDDPAHGFLGYVGTLVAAIGCAQAVVVAGRFARDEHDGLVEAARAAGPDVGQLALSWWIAALLGGALSLAAATCACTAVGPSALGVSTSDCLRLVMGQWPAVAATASLTILLATMWPPLRALTWIPVLVSLGIVQLGPALGASQRTIDASLLRQAGHTASLWLLAWSVLGVVLAVLAIRARDLRPALGRAQRSTTSVRTRRAGRPNLT